MGKILKCKKCGDIIQSKHRHDMVWCKCHSIAIDGGDDYFRWAGNKDDIEFYIEESRFQAHKETDAKTIQEQTDLIDQLKQQLAEKDRHIEQLKHLDDLNKTFFDLFRTAFKEPNEVDDLFNTLKTLQEKQDQAKISFAVEQLEKVKDYISSGLAFDMDVQMWFEEYIDNQIKQLKEGK